MKDIKTIVKEEVLNMLKEAPELLGIPELAEYISRLGYEVQDITTVLQQEYQNGGDEAVRKFFKEQTNIDLQILGRGKYAFKY